MKSQTLNQDSPRSRFVGRVGRKIRLNTPLLAAALALGLSATASKAQTNAFSLNVVGYVNFDFRPGDNWFGNPLQNTNASLSFLIPTAPDGTKVSLWDATANHYGPAATFSSGAWSSDLTLNPGTGALLHTPLDFINTFTGEVLDFNGSPYDGTQLHEPPPFAGPNGLYLFSSKAPATLSGHVFDPVNGPLAVFQAVIGRDPHQGEQVTTLNPLTQIYTTTTFMNGAWNNGDPALAVGQAALFNIGPVPEPSAVSLLALGLGMLSVLRRRR